MLADIGLNEYLVPSPSTSMPFVDYERERLQAEARLKSWKETKTGEALVSFPVLPF